MKKEESNKCRWHHRGGPGDGGAVYGLGLIGALVYYFQHVATFREGILAIFHALVWPALLIYKVLGMLHM